MSSNQDNTPTTGGAIANPPSTEHHQHTGYDERHQVPTIQNYLSRRDEEHKDNWDKGLSEEELQRAKDQEADRALRQEEDDKGAIMKRMQPNKNKPTDEVKERKGERTVKDPTTGHAVTIKDAEFKDYPEKSEMSAIQPAPSKAAVHHSRTSPSPASPTNISLLPFPPAAPMALASTISALQNLAYFAVFASFVLWLLIAFRHGFWVFAFRTALCVGFGAGGSFYAWKAARGVEKETEKVRWEMHRQRAEKFAPPFPESVEWLNALIETFWGLINPEMFLSTADMVEDIMQASLPALVDAVRISDIGQGTNPFRIISMRGLPDHPTDARYPREEWIDQGNAERKPGFSNQQEAADSDQAGDYVNLEVAFAYSAKPGKDEDSRSKNIHMLLEFFIGAFDWLHIPVPLWIQVESLVGTVRLRLQFIPVFPYVRNCTFTFMGVPAVEVSVVPMTRALPNVLDLPMVSSFVKMAIAAGTAEFVAPKSMTLNLQEMLSGAAIGDTQAIGAFVVTIHYGEDLSAQDRGGKSDPYIVLAYAKFGKPLYSTRIILGDLNPVYEETCVLLLTADEVKSEEALSLMLWDSDEHTSDDLIGRVKVDVKELMKEPNVTHRRADPLMGFEDADKMQGKLHWSVGYYEKAALNPKLEIPEEHPAVQPSKSLPEMEMRPGDAAPNPAAKDGPPPLPSPERTPPDSRWKSGILSVVIHQISNLEKRNLKGTTGKEREGVAGQDTDEPSEQTANLPSAYCEIVINDDLVYKTRVKQYTTMPFFEAGTEKFIRNFEDAIVRVVVRDSALREKDPILGIVNLPLKKLFAEASEVTRMFSLEEGQGFGRVNISLLFRPLKVDLPPNMLGWETGTVEVTAPCVIELDPAHTDLIDDFKKLTLSTSDSTEHLTKKEASITGNRIEWDVGRIRLPVYSRFQSVLTIQAMGSAHLGILGSEAKALAVLWLQELVDDEERVIRIPVLKSKDLKQLRQNYINEFTAKTHEYEIVGWLTTKVKLDAGLDEDHETAAANGPAGSQARRHALETWDRIEGQAELAERNAHANDDGHIDKEEAKAIKKANKRQDRNHQRGVHSFKPFRTARWMAEGVKERLTPHKDSSKREPTVQSEA